MRDTAFDDWDDEPEPDCRCQTMNNPPCTYCEHSSDQEPQPDDDVTATATSPEKPC